MGNYHAGLNTVNNIIEYDMLSTTGFKFKYSSQNTTRFYYYHVAGFRREELYG